MKEKRKTKQKFLCEKYILYGNIPDEIDGILVRDQEIPETYYDTAKPRCYGGVVIDENEERLLSLPPKFSVYEDIDTVKCVVQVEKGLSKLRWSMAKSSGEQRRDEEKGQREEQRKARDQYYNLEYKRKNGRRSLQNLQKEEESGLRTLKEKRRTGEVVVFSNR